MAYYSGSFDGNQLGRILSTHLSKPLVGTDLHVWRASLNGSSAEMLYFHSLLSKDEKERAERFYFERDRGRYIVGRGILRTLLSGYLGMDAHTVRIIYGRDGKPMLEDIFNKKHLQFNLSNSNDWVVYIFGWDNPVGIDLEHVRVFDAADDFAKQFFAAQETALLNSLTHDQKWDTFFKFWTAKESFLKAKGSGLTFPLNQVEIALGSGNDARIASINGDLQQAAKWRLETFNPIAGYQAAIAVEKNQGRILFQN